MKEILLSLWRLFQVGCAVFVAVLIAFGVVLIATGSLTPSRTRAAMEALRGKKADPPPRIPASLAEEWRKIEETRQETEHTFRKRDEELRKLETMTQLSLAQLDRDRRQLEKARDEERQARVEAQKERKRLEQKKIDAVTESNVTIYEEMKGPELAILMLEWDEKEVVRYLRLLSPEKSAQILRAMQADPKRKDKVDRILIEMQREQQSSKFNGRLASCFEL